MPRWAVRYVLQAIVAVCLVLWWFGMVDWWLWIIPAIPYVSWEFMLWAMDNEMP